MSEILRQYLRDLLTYINDIEQFTIGGKSGFVADRKTHYAVIRAYEVIGEIIKRLPDQLLDTQSQIDWRQVVRFRDFLAHNLRKSRSGLCMECSRRPAQSPRCGGSPVPGQCLRVQGKHAHRGAYQPPSVWFRLGGLGS